MTPPEPQPAPMLWRGAKAVGASAGSALARPLRRLFFLLFIVVLVVVAYRMVSEAVRTPGQPSRPVAASDGQTLLRLRQAGSGEVSLTEQDLTAAFLSATKLPTFPFRDGQVAVVGSTIEIFGHLKHGSYTAIIVGQPVVENKKFAFNIVSIAIGHQGVPRFLFPFLALPTVDQAALFVNTLIPPLRSVAATDGALLFVFL